MHVKYRTSPQEHEFGRPFQLGSQPTADKPEDCMFASIKIAAGDVVVMGSDGLWDNIFDRQVRARPMLRVLLPTVLCFWPLQRMFVVIRPVDTHA
jgi:hypothetical protein